MKKGFDEKRGGIRGFRVDFFFKQFHKWMGDLNVEY